MSDLVEWLTKILDEDSDPSEIPHASACNSVMGGEAGWGLRKCDCEIPAHWLADIAAKRAIIADYKRLLFNDPLRRTDYFRGQRDALEYTVKHLAEAYAARPGYDESWRP